MSLDLDAIRARLEAATPGPWRWERDEGGVLRDESDCGKRCAPPRSAVTVSRMRWKTPTASGTTGRHCADGARSRPAPTRCYSASSFVTGLLRGRSS